MVATPIGNLADISLRALQILANADVIACEDTRHTKQLYQALNLGMDKNFIACHQHNEHEAAEKIIHHLAKNQRVVYVSDAGTPGISDPGGILVDDVRKAGYRILPIGGISSVHTLLSAAGTGFQPYTFYGFMPSKTQAADDFMQTMAQQTHAVVFFETAPRIKKTLSLCEAHFKHRDICIGRELSKQFECIQRYTLGQIRPEITTKGEFCLAIAAPNASADKGNDITFIEAHLKFLLQHMRTKDAVNAIVDYPPQYLVAGGHDVNKKMLYELALRIKDQANDTN